jgi:hypothetical protein
VTVPTRPGSFSIGLVRRICSGPAGGVLGLLARRRGRRERQLDALATLGGGFGPGTGFSSAW